MKQISMKQIKSILQRKMIEHLYTNYDDPKAVWVNCASDVVLTKRQEK